MIRRPTEKEYREFDGLHCHRLWASLSDYWRCPSCGRSKREIMIWGRRKGSNAINYGEIGFKCGLHKHHDHGSHHNGVERFPETIICNACNALDGRLKRGLNTVKEFSFSPQELNSIIKKASPNTSIRNCDVDVKVAAEIYSRHNNQMQQSKTALCNF